MAYLEEPPHKVEYLVVYGPWDVINCTRLGLSLAKEAAQRLADGFHPTNPNKGTVRIIKRTEAVCWRETPEEATEIPDDSDDE